LPGLLVSHHIFGDPYTSRSRSLRMTPRRRLAAADVLIVCCDGLTGFPEAIEATWPDSLVQTCVVHLIRASMRFVSYGQRKAVAAALKTVYQASDAEAARAALDAFAASEVGARNPNTIRVFDDAWERFLPFLAFPPMLRVSSTQPMPSSR
jgi:putative transposase